MRVVHQLRISAGQLDRLHHERQHLEEERLTRTAIALILLTDFIVHGQRCPGAHEILISVQHIAEREYLVYQVLLLLDDLVRAKPLAIDAKGVSHQICCSSRAVFAESGLSLSAPVESGSVDEIAEEMAVDILYVNIKHGLALVVFIDRDAEHVRQALEPMTDNIFFPHVVVQPVGTRVILLEALGVSLARQAHLYSLVRKEEIL